MKELDRTNISYICDNCRTEFYLTKKQLKSSYKKHYCCRECYDASRFIDLTGEKFGRWTVKEYAGRNNVGVSLWSCECECGNFGVVTRDRLISKSISSCGCYKKEHPHKIHGLSGSRLYRIWKGMRARCKQNNNYITSNYGDRGIHVCEDWDDYQLFYDWAQLNGYNEHLTLDRIDNNLGYFPDNCRWATMREQANNKTTNINLTYKGKTQTISQWADDLGITSSAFRSRRDRGLLEDELFAKKKQVKSKGQQFRGDRLDRIWAGMKNRCLNSKNSSYKLYGGRGINVCKEWLSNNNFREWALANGYKETLSIDRIDVEGDYCPTNCRWATSKEQGRNKRNTLKLTVNGETLSLKEWSEISGVSCGVLKDRLKIENLSEEQLFYVGNLKHFSKSNNLKKIRENS